MNAAVFRWRAIALPAFGPSLMFGMGEGAILPVLPLSARALGASVPEAALLVALIGLGSMLGNIPASIITMRHGERLTIVAAAIVGALAMALCALTSSLVVFASGAFVIGIAQAVFSLARQSWMAEAVPRELRARAMSMLGGMLRVGMFAGPFLAAAAIGMWGISAAYGVGVAALLVAAVVSWRLPDLEVRDVDSTAHGVDGTARSIDDAASAGASQALRAGASQAPRAGASQAPRASSAPRASWRSIVRDHRHVFLTLGVGVMLVAAVRAARQAVIPLWADHLGLDASVTSLIYGVAGGIEMLVFYPAGFVMDRKGRLAVALPSMLIMGAALLLMPLTTSAVTLLIAATAVGFGNGIGSGLIMTLGADHAPRDARAHFLGIWRLMTDIGAACGPGLVSLLTAVATLGVGVAAVGLLAFGAAAQLAYWLPRRR